MWVGRKWCEAGVMNDGRGVRGSEWGRKWVGKGLRGRGVKRRGERSGKGGWKNWG